MAKHKIKIIDALDGCIVDGETTKSGKTEVNRNDRVRWKNKRDKDVTIEFTNGHPFEDFDGTVTIKAGEKSDKYEVRENIAGEFGYTTDCEKKESGPKIIVNAPPE